MSELSRGSVGVQQALKIATDPRPIPSIYEAIPTDPPPIPTSGGPIPRIPPLRGGSGTGSGIGARSTPMPGWLLQLLSDHGAITERGFTRRARVHPCPTCCGTTIAGLDADHAAFEARCDIEPLNREGEAGALTAGRRTLALHAAGSRRWEFERRTPRGIRAHPAADPGTQPVLAEHRCAEPIPAAWCAPTPPAPTPTGGGDEW